MKTPKIPVILHPSLQGSRKRRSALASIAAVTGIFACAQSATAATLVINSSGDRTIRSTGTTPSATDPVILIGDTITAGDYLRGAFAFNLADPLLVGATINSITLTLTIDSADGTSQNTNVTVNLHQLSSSFTESGVTWTSRDGTNSWATVGGDYGSLLDSEVKNPRTVTGTSTFIFDIAPASIATGVTNESGVLYLLAKLDVESNTNRNLFRIRSEENLGAKPALTIDYTAAVPEPNVAALLGGLGLLALLRRRR